MDNNKNFVVSAILAFTIYFSFFGLFFYYVKNSTVKKIAVSNKITILQLDIIMDQTKIKNKQVSTKEIIKNTKIAKKVVKKSASTSVKQRSNLKSLFANVKTNAKKVKKAKILNVKQSSISSRFKKKLEKEKKVKNLKLSKLIETKKKKSVTQNKNKLKTKNNKNDPYFTKINQMVHQSWQPTIYNKEATVIVTISAQGRFSYKFTKYSGDTIFDNQLRDYLNNETLKRYPISPMNKTVTIEIIFKSKG